MTLMLCSGSVHLGESGDENDDDADVAVRGIFPRSLYCRYVLPELYKIFHVRDALVRATLLRHFHRYAAMFDHTSLTQLILPQVCFVSLTSLTVMTRSTGTVHTPTKARLTSASIWRISMSSRFVSVNRFPYLAIVTNLENNPCI